ncbi:MAG TPA: hypothetical protein VFV75_08560, partial [Candidatus Polarisedimenticolaceae bacterium]|nr:hypothetical protein [Candidatus Polarisedimenticolaceae bacterium]
MAALLLASLAAGAPASGLKLAPKPKPIEGTVPPVPQVQALPSRVTPLRVGLLDGPSLLAQLPALTDRDTATALALPSPLSLVFDLEEVTTVSGLRLFGHPELSLSVSYADAAGWVAVPGLERVGAGQLGEGWNDLRPAAPFTTAALRVDVTPEAGGAALPDLEIWSERELSLLPGSPDRLLTSQGNCALRTFSAPSAEIAIESAPVAVSIDLPREPAQFRRAYLVYELLGLRSWMAVPRALNGGVPAAGMVDSPTLEWAPQIERIDPAALRAGENRISFEPSFGGLPYKLRNVRLLVELDTASNAIELVAAAGEPAVERALHPAADGDLTTAWLPAEPGALMLDLDRRVETRQLGLLLAAAASGVL